MRMGRSVMSERIALISFLALVVGGGLGIGYVTSPGEWYAQLAKPSFNPPGWIFAPVWTLLYVLIAIAGWHVWLYDRDGWTMKLWWFQLVLNFLWSPRSSRRIKSASRLPSFFCFLPPSCLLSPRHGS